MYAGPSISVERLSSRRRALGMSYEALSELSGVSVATVKRMLGGRLGESSFASVTAVARALGVSIGLEEEVDADELRRRQARRQAERVAGLVQGTSALESQAVDGRTYERLIEKTYHELLAGSNRKLWAH